MAFRNGRWAMVAGLCCLLTCLLAACTPQPLLAEVKAAPTVITPDGESRAGLATISYQLSQPASVSIYLVDESGQTYPFRTEERRPAGSFQAPFAGAVKPSPDGDTQRVLPDGVYTYVVEAATPTGARAEAKGTLTIQGADPQPLEVTDLVAVPATITPNGDARDDKTAISYRLSKEAEVEIYATDPSGQRYLIEPPTQRPVGLHGREWNGSSGGILAADGEYQVHVVARDKAGNITEGIVPVTLAEGGRPSCRSSKRSSRRPRSPRVARSRSGSELRTPAIRPFTPRDRRPEPPSQPTPIPPIPTRSSRTTSPSRARTAGRSTSTKPAAGGSP